MPSMANMATTLDVCMDGEYSDARKLACLQGSERVTALTSVGVNVMRLTVGRVFVVFTET
jgi:hypothetical protein